MAVLFVVEADFTNVRLDLDLASEVAQFLPSALTMPIDQSVVEVADQALEPGLNAHHDLRDVLLGCRASLGLIRRMARHGLAGAARILRALADELESLAGVP